jgi:hypothetical protein
VCDWVLVAGKYCLLVDATNHWLDEKAAQGFADEADYWTDTEETFVNKKFLQLKSTIELLAEKGWQECTFDDQTVYVPLVIVPNAGIPATVMSDVDFKLRSHSVLGQFGKIVTAPGILIYRELQVFEGLCEHRAPKAFVEMLAKWLVVTLTSHNVLLQKVDEWEQPHRRFLQGNLPTDVGHYFDVKTLSYVDAAGPGRIHMQDLVFAIDAGVTMWMAVAGRENVDNYPEVQAVAYAQWFTYAFALWEECRDRRDEHASWPGHATSSERV